MCDVFEPPCFARPYQKYEVHKKRAPGHSEVHLVGIDKIDKTCSVMRIPMPQTPHPSAELELQDGMEVFPLRELNSYVQRLKASDGSYERGDTGVGIVGFIQFMQGYYLILIKKHRKVGKIGHHAVYCIEETVLIPLFGDAHRDDGRFKKEFPSLTTKDYYYSYSYDLSRSYQQNLADALRFRLGGGAAAGRPMTRPLYTEHHELKHHRFVWNHYHMGPLIKKQALSRWCLPIIHGFFQNTKCSSHGWTFEVVLIARRSRFFAGTRYNKRGLNIDGHVANDVETEQLLCEDATRHLDRGHVMSFVQMRGSVPLFWSQEATAMNPKPPIVYTRCDPTLSATRKHFADLLERYGTPQLVINLMKAKRQDSDEVRLSKHYESAIERINREIPAEVRVMYRPFDVKGHAKSESKEPVQKVFTSLAQSAVSRVGFLHTIHGSYGPPEHVQCGVIRTNCVDCLDRTNVMQFFTGLEVLKKQLTTLHLMQDSKMFNESQVARVLSEIYDDMGDHLALQYAGSKVHKKYQLQGVRPRMLQKTADTVTTALSRHYNNTMNDTGRQAAMNLFLGIYKPAEDAKFLEGEVDSWVHHKVLKDNYVPGNWWDPPLEAYFQHMSVLREPLPRQIPRPLRDEQLSWFRVVHKNWKLTFFEKLVSPSQGLFSLVSIHPTANSLPARLAGERERLGQRPRPRFVMPTDEGTLEVRDEDLVKYMHYADVRQLSRLNWMLEEDQAREVTAALQVPWQPELLPCQGLLVAGDTVALCCASLGSFARMDGTGKVIAVLPEMPENSIPGDRSWELFTVVSAGKGQIALHSPVHNCFLRMSSAGVDASASKGAGELPADWAWERFTVVGAGGDKVALHNTAHNRFVRMTHHGLDVSQPAAAADLRPDWADVRFKVFKEGSSWATLGSVGDAVRRASIREAAHGRRPAPRLEKEVEGKPRKAKAGEGPPTSEELEAVLRRYQDLRAPAPAALQMVPSGAAARTVGCLGSPVVAALGSPAGLPPRRLGRLDQRQYRSDPDFSRRLSDEQPLPVAASRRPVFSDREPRAAEASWSLPGVKEVFCSYCGQLFFQDPDEPREAVGRTSSQQSSRPEQLCPEHRHTASDLESFRRSGSFLQQSPAEKEKVGQLVFRSWSADSGPAPAWQHWIEVQAPEPTGLSGIDSHSYDRRSRHHSHTSYGGLSGYERHPSGLSQIPERGLLDQRWASTPTGHTVMGNSYEGASQQSAQGSYESPTRPALRQRPATTSNLGGPPGAGPISAGAAGMGLSLTSAATRGGEPTREAAPPRGSSIPGMDAALAKHLRCYVFPAAPPPVAEAEELGLPAWWLQSLKRPKPLLVPSGDEQGACCADLGNDGTKERGQKKRKGMRKQPLSDRRPPIAITPPSAAQSLAARVAPGGADQRSPKDFGKPSKAEEGVVQSVFATSAILDELEAAELTEKSASPDHASPTGILKPRTSFIGGHHRARSSMV